MDPISIAAGAAGLTTGCAVIIKTLYIWINEIADIDENVSGLCEEVTALSRVLESVGNASIQVPRLVVSEIDPENSLWASVKETLDNIKITLDKLNQLLVETQKSTVFSRGFFRKSTKQMRLALRSKDITMYRERIQSYNTAMTSALQMINVCLLIHSSSSQDSVLKLLSGLKSQVKRVEVALQANSQTASNSRELTDEDNRISHTLRQFVNVGEKFHSSASTIVREGPRSTVWGGSVMGDPLTKDQVSNIEKWIPSPTSEEATERIDKALDEFTKSAQSSSTVVEQDHFSESDDDIDKDLAKRLEELAIQSRSQGQNAKAESFYRKAIERSGGGKRPKQEIQAMQMDLAQVCMLQEKWAEAEAIISPMAFSRQVQDIVVYHAMHALALSHKQNAKLDIAYRYCKRALWGKRKVIGQSHPSYCDTLALLASICDERDDGAEAEAHRSFISPSVQVVVDVNPLSYVKRRLTTLEEPEDLASVQPSGSIETMQNPALSSTPVLPDSTESTENTSDQVQPQGLFQAPASEYIASIQPWQNSIYSASAQFGSLHGGLFQHRRSLSSPLENMEQPPSHSKLVVGIHFGIMHSSVAFVSTHDMGKEGIITDWPGATYSKPTVPTLLFYDVYGQILGWGCDINQAVVASTGQTAFGVERAEWFRLQLLLEGNRYMKPENIHLPPLPHGKKASEVATDYLYKLRQAIRFDLHAQLGDDFLDEERNIYWCFTVPAHINSEGKNTFRKVIRDAGFLRDADDHRLLFVPEPMANILCLSTMNLLKLRRSETLLIVDCGSAMIELVAYEVQGENPLNLKELTTPSGEFSGSTSLNRNFKNILSDKVAKLSMPLNNLTSFVHDLVYSRAMTDFDSRIKSSFCNNGQNWIIDVGIGTQLEKQGFEKRYMSFSDEEILSCFQPVVSRIIDLIKVQISLIQAQNRFLQNIVITGELASSEYVFQEIKNSFYHLQSKILRPVDPDVTTVKGAILAGLSAMAQN